MKDIMNVLGQLPDVVSYLKGYMEVKSAIDHLSYEDKMKVLGITAALETNQYLSEKEKDNEKKNQKE